MRFASQPIRIFQPGGVQHALLTRQACRSQPEYRGGLPSWDCTGRYLRIRADDADETDTEERGGLTVSSFLGLLVFLVALFRRRKEEWPRETRRDTKRTEKQSEVRRKRRASPESSVSASSAVSACIRNSLSPAVVPLPFLRRGGSPVAGPLRLLEMAAQAADAVHLERDDPADHGQRRAEDHRIVRLTRRIVLQVR
jgi:hypothetical protein